MPTITVKRKPGGYTDRARKYKFVVDHQEVGRVGAGETASVEVAPGPHEVMMKMDLNQSPPLTVDVADGRDANLHCAPNANALTGFYYGTLGRKKYIALRQV